MQQTALPRSRALVVLDGPGHIMPIEPVTPAGSRIWRVIHSPFALLAIAAGLLVLAAAGIVMLGTGLRVINYVRGLRYAAALLSAAMIVMSYWLFVRFVERRPELTEFGVRGWLGEVAIGFCGGAVLVAAPFTLLYLLGALRITGFNSLQVMALPLVSQLCGAIILEIVQRGFFFRQTERLLGSWIALGLMATLFAVAALIRDPTAPLTILADSLGAGLLFSVVYMVTRRLWAVIALHAAWNLANVGLYGAASLSDGQRGLVLSQTAGPEWLIGERFGVYTSVPALIVSALAVAILLAIAVRRQHIVRPSWQRGRHAATG